MMSFDPRCIGLAFALLFTSAISAQGLSQLELNEAAEQQRQASEFMLDKAYEQVADLLVGERLKLLEASQAEWLQYREASLRFITSKYYGGSFAPLIYAQTAVRMNQDRIAELTAIHLEEITP